MDVKDARRRAQCIREFPPAIREGITLYQVVLSLDAEVERLRKELGQYIGAEANEYGQSVQKIKKLQAEVERLKEEQRLQELGVVNKGYGGVPLDSISKTHTLYVMMKENERLKGIITDVGSSGIEWEGDKYTTVQVYADAWRKCRQMAMDEIEQDAREQQTA